MINTLKGVLSVDNKALTVAYNAHIKQNRKGTDIPYIVHPLEVAVILIENGADEDVINAGLLHDTLEDTDISLEYLVENFGRKVAELVKGASEPYKLNLETKLSDDERKVSWKLRKNHTIEYLKTAPLDIKLITCADKLSNIRSLVRDYEKVGDNLWQRFNAGYEEQKWYYNSLIESLKGLEDYDMYNELRGLAAKIF